jgi:DNA-binding MarR family transcriptional regulator
MAVADRMRYTAPVTDAPSRAGNGKRRDDSLDAYVNAILVASRVLVAVSARSLADVEDIVTVTQVRALVVLDTHDGVNLNGLAEKLDVNPSTAMRMIDRLLVTELVTRRDNPENRREVVLSLTSAGRRIVRKVTNRRRQEIRRIVETMPATHRANMIRALQAFSEAAGEPDLSGDSSLGW